MRGNHVEVLLNKLMKLERGFNITSSTNRVVHGLPEPSKVRDSNSFTI